MNQEHSALVKSNYDKLPREAKKTTDTTLDRIYKYYHNSKTRIELTREEHAIRERWEKAWLLRCRHRTTKQTADLIAKLFNVSLSVAFDDVSKASMIFSDPSGDLRQAKRALAEHAYLMGADKAWKKGDLDMHMKYMNLYAEINGLKNDTTDSNLADLLKKLKPHQVVIVASPEQLEVDAVKLRDEIAQDAEFSVIDETAS